jgi:hypothetical protein
MSDKVTGAVVTKRLPVITMTKQATGRSTPPGSIMARHDGQGGKKGRRFGRDIRLVDGNTRSL